MSRMTFYHKELLVEFLELNRCMVRARGARGESTNVEEVKRLWEEVATKLSEAGAVKRSGEEWKKAWGELLCRTKKLAKIYSKSEIDQKKLTPLDHRILAAGYGNLVLKNKVDCAGMKYESKPNSEVKTEAVFTDDLPDDYHNEDDDEDDLPLHPQLPDHRTDGQAQRDMLLDNSPPSSPTHNVRRKAPDPASLDETDIYPKWLINVEKTRARAELKRANAACKNADAALMQAEAMLKLADASTLQAEAIMRIASALESRNS